MTKIRNATTTLTAANVTNGGADHSVPVGTDAGSTSIQIPLSELKDWLKIVLNKIAQLDSSVEVIDTGGASYVKVVIDNTDEYRFNINAFNPTTNDGAAIGAPTKRWSDAYFAAGSIISFGVTPVVADDPVLLTHSASKLTLSHGDLALGGNNLITTGYTGRDADNLLSWDVDDVLKIIIGGITHSIVSITDGAADNDKLITQGYVDDAVGGAISPAILSKIDDTNITLTLGGTPNTSLLQAVSLTLGWTGLLSIARGGTNSTTALGNDKVMISSAGAIIESATITTTELGLLNNMVSVSTGIADNDKLVTQGYVDDNDDAGANVALSNLSGVAINESLVSDTDNTDALGTVEKAWSDLVLGNESVVTWTSEPNEADVTLTHSADLLTLEGGQLDVIHSTTEANMSAVNVCYGTGSPPATANEGTLFIQYT